MRTLVTGAAGYIGSVVAERLVAEGHSVLAMDSLKYGHREAIPSGAEFVRADLLDSAPLQALFTQNRFDCVVHLAGESKVDESMRDPGLFFQVNVAGGLNLLEAMRGAGVGRIVFSSTAAVYGEPESVPIVEAAPTRPVNPYGESKWMFEQILGWYRRTYGLRYVSLRYFNACGATETHGEARQKPSHIIPLLLETALGKRDGFTLYGEDYPTPDGTCIRDYVHVLDIAEAHLLAMRRIDDLGARTYNVGSGSGHSNREVVASVRRVTGIELEPLIGPRRPGDPASLVAASELISSELGWKARIPDLDAMIRSAWEWLRRHPNGYSASGAGA